MPVTGSAPNLSSLFFHVTNDCNQQCIHCWVDAGYAARKTGSLLSADECATLVRQACELGLQSVKVTGGEPLLRPDVTVRIVQEASRLGLFSTVETNATLLTEEMASRLAGAGLSEICISLDTHRPEVYAHIRRGSVGLEQVAANIGRAMRHGLRVTTLTAVFATTIDDIEETCTYVLETLGVSTARISPCVPMGRARTGERLALSSSELKALAERLVRLAERYPRRVATILPWSLVNPASAVVQIRCRFTEILGVMPNGDVSVCGIGLGHPEAVLGNIRRSTLQEIWVDSPALERLRTATARDFKGVCGRCVLAAHCANVCPAMSYEIYGNLLGPCPMCEQLLQDGLFPEELLVR